MWQAFLLAAALNGATDARGLDSFTAAVDQIVLSGRQMPPAMLLDVARLPDAADRMMAIIYLRRAGLLTDDPLSLDRIVFPRQAAEGKKDNQTGLPDAD